MGGPTYVSQDYQLLKLTGGKSIWGKIVWKCKLSSVYILVHRVLSFLYIEMKRRINIFPCISLETPYMCVKTLRTGLIFLRRSIWEVTCIGLLQHDHFPIYLLVNPINVCWNSHLSYLSLYIYISSVMVCKACVLDWLGVHIPSLSIYI